MLSPEIKDATDEYANRIKEIIIELEKIEEFTKIENGYRTSKKVFTTTDTILEERKNELTSLKQQVIDYFTSIGSTPDSIADVDRATSNIAIISNEISETEKKIHLKNEQLKGLVEQTSDIKNLATQCDEIITKRLEKINKDLDIENENVEKIKFEFRFDNNKFLNGLYKDFNDNFKTYQKPNLSWDNIYWCLR
eukprot:Opistho-1_new@61890